MTVTNLIIFWGRTLEGARKFGVEKPLSSQSLMNCSGYLEVNAESSVGNRGLVCEVLKGSFSLLRLYLGCLCDILN